MMVSAPTNTSRAMEAETYLDNIAGWVQHLQKFKHFYDQMDFNPEQRLAITKSIIELTDPTERYDMVEGRSRHRSRFDEDAAVFYDDELRNLQTTHNKSIYLIASVNEVKLKRAMLDPGSLLTLHAVGVSRDKIDHQEVNRSV